MNEAAQANTPYLTKMKFCLISPPIAIQKFDFLGSGIPYWPIELAILASHIQLKDKLQIIDMFGSNPSNIEFREKYYLQGISRHKLLNRIQIDSDVIIIFAISYMSHLEILDLIRLLKSIYPKKKLGVLENSQSVTGYAIDVHKADFFRAGADFLLCGDVSNDWESVRSAIADDRQSNTSMLRPGDASKIIRKVFKSGAVPFPAWNLFPIKNYWKLPYSHGPKFKKFLPILTSKGCPYSCDFCVVPETNARKWRPRNPHDVVNEMEYMSKVFSVTHFQIEDLNPTVDSKRWYEISTLIIDKGLKFTYSFVSGTKAETLKIMDLKHYKASGLRYFSISPESGSPRLMRVIGKHFDFQYALQLIKESKINGIYSQACFVVGHPDETEEDFRQTRTYLRELLEAGLSEVAFFIITALPGSKLHSSSKIDEIGSQAFTSFTPKNRKNFQELKIKRRILIFDFVKFKIKHPKDLILHSYRSILGKPQTKMENLPRRICYIIIIIVKAYLLNILKKIRKVTRL